VQIPGTGVLVMPRAAILLLFVLLMFFIVFLLRMLTIIIHLRLSYLTLTLTLKKFRCKSVLCDGVNYSDHNDYHPQHFVFTLKSLKLTCVAQLVERLSLTGEISLYYARPACSCWVYRPL